MPHLDQGCNSYDRSAVADESLWVQAICPRCGYRGRLRWAIPAECYHGDVRKCLRCGRLCTLDDAKQGKQDDDV